MCEKIVYYLKFTDKYFSLKFTIDKEENILYTDNNTSLSSTIDKDNRLINNFNLKAI